MFLPKQGSFFQSKEVSCRARKVLAEQGRFSQSEEGSCRARKVLAKAKKIPAKFNVYCSRTSLLLRRLDVTSPSQIKTRSMFDWAAFSLDLQARDHVTQRTLRITFGLKLLSIRVILPSLAKDHVKHVFEHVTLCVELPCLRAITSNLAWNFPAYARSRQASSEASLLTGDRVVHRRARISAVDQFRTVRP
jgi:hypothetical protein